MAVAYLMFQEIGGAAAMRAVAAPSVAATPRHDAGGETRDRLTPLEWSVVAIARKDGPATLRRPGKLTNLVRALLRQGNPMLADARLEALRRMAVLSWRDGYTVPPHEVRAFLVAGFSADQYEAMVDHISAARAIQPRTVTGR